MVSVDEAWGASDLLLKVKEPIEPEYARLREGLVLFTYLHIAADEPLTRALADSGIAAVAYETVETDDRRLPLLAPMSEIAGRLAPQAAAHFLEKPLGGRGVLLAGTPGVQPGHVVVLGGGIVGYNAAIIALGLGARVTLLERSIDRMRHLDEILSGRVSLIMSSSLEIEQTIAHADVVIGAVLIPGARAPKLISREMLSDMQPGAVIVDVAIDQGGCIETAHPDDALGSRLRGRRDRPLLRREHARRRPVTSTKALTNATLPYVEAIADHGLADGGGDGSVARRGVNVLDGKITYEAVAEAHGLDYTPLDDVLPLAPV